MTDPIEDVPEAWLVRLRTLCEMCDPDELTDADYAAIQSTSRRLYRYVAEKARIEYVTTEDDLRDLCDAVFRVGWDRDLSDVKRFAEEIIARRDMTLSTPLAARQP